MRKALLSWLFSLGFLLNTKAQDFQMSAPNIMPASYSGVDVAVDDQFLWAIGLGTASIDNQPNNGAYDAVIMKYLLNGTRLWTRAYGDSANNLPMKLMLFQGDLIVVGYTIYKNNAPSFVLRYASNGTLVFSNSPPCPSGYCESYDVAAIDDSTMVVAGSYGNAIAMIQYSLLNGTLLKVWILVTPASSYFDQAYGIVETGVPGEFIAVGDTSSAFGTGQAMGSDDHFVTNINVRNSTIYWARIRGYAYLDIWYGVAFDLSSQLAFVTGSTFNYGYNDAVTGCYHANGTFMWISQFGSSINDVSYDVKVHPISRQVFVVGYMQGGYAGKTLSSYDGFVQVYAQNGTITTPATFGNVIGADNSFISIAFSSNGKLAYVSDNYANSDIVILNISLPSTARPSVVTSALPPVSTFLAITASATTKPPAKTLAASPILRLPQSSTAFPDSATSAATSTTTDAASQSDAAGLSTAPTATPKLDQPVYAQAPQAILAIPMTYLITGAACVLVVLLTIATLYFVCRPKKATSSTSLETDAPTAIFDGFSTAMSEMPSGTMFENMTLNGGGTTMLRTDLELSLPGYLGIAFKKDISIVRQLAKGGGGTIYVAKSNLPSLKTFGPECVVKVVKHDRLETMTAEEQQVFKQEVSIMHYFRENKHFAKLLGWSDDPACLILKYYRFGSLDTWIQGHARRSRLTQLGFMIDICSAVLAMHDSGFAHCDLKPQNILIDQENGRLFCVLTDFGITQIVAEKALLVKSFQVLNARGMSFLYAAPETVLFFRSNGLVDNLSGTQFKSVDVFSLALIVQQILTGIPPWGRRR